MRTKIDKLMQKTYYDLDVAMKSIGVYGVRHENRIGVIKTIRKCVMDV